MGSIRVFKIIECPSCNYIHWMGCSAMSSAELIKLSDDIKEGIRADEKVSVDKRHWTVYMTCDRCQE